MADVFTLNGTALNLAATDALPTVFRERFGCVPSLTIQRRGIPPVTEASDTWMGKGLTWSSGGTVYFSGVIRSRSPRRDPEVGWITDYQAIGIRDNMDKFPVTDKTTGQDFSPFNCQPEDLVNFNAARAGRTVGQMISDVLLSNTNANNLAAYNLGNYTGLPTTPALPAITVADLAALTIVPPRPCYIAGEKFGSAIDGFLAKNAPNVRMWVKPNGDIRFLDLTTFAASTLTMGVDPIEPTEISRDVGDCWQRILIRGAPLAVMGLFKLSLSTLTEDFGYGSTSNTAAKAAWTPADFKGTSQSQDHGTCTCPSTTTVVVTSSSATVTWAANYWDQTATGRKGSVNLEWSAGAGITTFWTARIVSNTALSAGGTSTLTLDSALPHTSFNRYTLTGQTAGASQVWRRYLIADTTIWPLVVSQSTYPQPIVNGGGGASLTSSMVGLVFWPQTGSSPPYNCFPLPFVWDGSTGHVIFQAPTYTVANSTAPADVWVYLPVNTGPNQVASPANTGSTPNFSGDSNSIEGLTDTLIVTMPEWRDPGQKSQVQSFANDWIKSVNNGIREASIMYHGLYINALTFGMGLSIAGNTDSGTTNTTGWESANIPVVGVEVEFVNHGPDDYITTIEVSSRRGHYSAEMFLKPERTYTPIGLPFGSEVAVLGGAGAYQDALGGYQDRLQSARQPYVDALGGYQDALGGALERGGRSANDDPTTRASDLAASQQPGEFTGIDPSGGMDFGSSGGQGASRGQSSDDSGGSGPARRGDPEGDTGREAYFAQKAREKKEQDVRDAIELNRWARESDVYRKQKDQENSRRDFAERIAEKERIEKQKREEMDRRNRDPGGHG